MKKLLLLLMFVSAPLFGQVAQLTAPDCQFGFMYSVVSNVITSTSSVSAQRLPLSQDSSAVVGYDNRNTNCTSWTLMYQADSGVTPLSIELDQAPSNGDVPGSWSTWANPAPGTVLPLTTAANGNGSMFSFQPWVSVNLNSATGTGRVYGRVIGWKPQAGSDVTAPGNSVVIAGFSYKAITTSTNTQVKATPGIVHTLTITQPGATSQAITLVDTSVANCTGGTTVATIPAAQLVSTMVPDTLTLDIATVNGICVITAGTTPPQLVVSFR